MKVLLISDLHLTLPWFEWLNTKAAAFDLICISGDFLDLFGQEPKPKQVAQVQGYLRHLASITNLAFCSGNHDSYGPIVPAARGPTYPWLAELDEIQSIISDGQTRIIKAKEAAERRSGSKLIRITTCQQTRQKSCSHTDVITRTAGLSRCSEL
jgi:predicted MPP superfamily phosphohydrolase